MESGNKMINQIQSILQSKKAKNISNRVIGAIGDLAITFRDDSGYKRKANKDKECYNCHKLGHFRHDCRQPDKRLARIERPSTRERTDNSNNKSRSQAPQQVH